MSNTATAACYRQLLQPNQGLAAQGATSIELSQLSWGAISIAGNSATSQQVPLAVEPGDSVTASTSDESSRS